MAPTKERSLRMGEITVLTGGAFQQNGEASLHMWETPLRIVRNTASEWGSHCPTRRNKRSGVGSHALELGSYRSQVGRRPSHRAGYLPTNEKCSHLSHAFRPKQALPSQGWKKFNPAIPAPLAHSVHLVKYPIPLTPLRTPRFHPPRSSAPWLSGLPRAECPSARGRAAQNLPASPAPGSL